MRSSALRSSSALSALMGLAAVLGGCEKSTEMLLVFSSDIDPSMYAALQVDVSRSDADAATFSNRYELPAQTTLPASLDLHATSGAPVITVEAQLLDGNGTTLVSRTAIAPFEPGHGVELRLALDSDCADVACAPGLTCIGHACVSPYTNDLPPIPSDPLTTLDMAQDVSDLATPDLAPPDDLAVLCPMPGPQGKVGGLNCTQYTFGSGTIPSAFAMTMGGATIDFDCGNLNVNMPAGTHTYQNGGAFQLIATQAFSGTYAVTAGYAQAGAGNAWAGVIVPYGASGFTSIRTSPATSGNDTYEIEVYDPSQVPTDQTYVPGVSQHTGEHSVLMQQTPTENSPDYTYGIDGSELPPHVSLVGLALNQAPGFYVGNDSSTGVTNNAFRVTIGSIALCTQ